MVPIEFEIPSLRVTIEDRLLAHKSLQERDYQIEKLEEERENANQRVAHQQHLTKKYHNKKLKITKLQHRDLVLLYDSRFVHFPGKLHTRWLGPYTVHNIFWNGFVQPTTLQ